MQTKVVRCNAVFTNAVRPTRREQHYIPGRCTGLCASRHVALSSHTDASDNRLSTRRDDGTIPHSLYINYNKCIHNLLPSTFCALSANRQ